jgi:hypothetical protein
VLVFNRVFQPIDTLLPHHMTVRNQRRHVLARSRLRIAGAAPAIALSLGLPLPAHGHAFAQRYDLPLPLSLYIAGAGAAVAFSFVVIALALRGASTREYRRINLLHWRLGRALAHPATVFFFRLMSVAVLALVVYAGFFGRQDPFRNIAPVTVWVIGWVGIAYASVLLGDLWAVLNPWRTLFSWAEFVHRRLRSGRELSLRLPYPQWLGVWPAVVLFAVFAWAELVWHDRDVPAKLATVLVAYSIITWSGMLAFGREMWLRCGEVFSLVFGLLARFAPTEARVSNPALCKACSTPCCRDTPGECINCYACLERAAFTERQWNLRPYAVGLVARRPVSTSMMALVLLMLSTVTFDGFRETPLWADIYELLLTAPGVRSVLIDLYGGGTDMATVIDTLGFVGFPLAFLIVYLAVSGLMCMATGNAVSSGPLARLFVLSLVPIAIAYHLAHYLSYLLTVGQYIIPLASDPFGFGWDLLGTRLYFIRIGIVDARFVWYTAVLAIVTGHIAAVYLAHVIALGVLSTPRLAFRSQIPMVALMIGYTMVSLWILAQPIVAAPVGSQQRACALEGVAEVQVDRLVTLQHQAQEGLLQPVFDIAYGQGADPDRARGGGSMRKRDAEVFELDARDPEGRHGVDVAGHLDPLGVGDDLGVQHLDPSLGGTEPNVGVGDEEGLIGIRAGIGPAQRGTAEAVVFLGHGQGLITREVIDQGGVGPVQGGDDTSGDPDRTGPPENHSAALRQAHAVLGLELLFHAGD